MTTFSNIIPLGTNLYHVDSSVNPKAELSVFKQLQGYSETALGGYKTTVAVKNILDVAAKTAELTGDHAFTGTLYSGSRVFSNMAGGFIAAHLFSTTIGLGDAIQTASKDASAVNVEKVAKSALDVTSAGCNTMRSFSANPVLKEVALFADMGSTAIDLRQQASAWSLATDLEKQDNVANETKAGLVQEKKLRLLGMIKAVVTLMGSVFTAIALYFTSAIPTIVAATVNLAAVALTFAKELYAQNMDHKVAIRLDVAPAK